MTTIRVIDANPIGSTPYRKQPHMIINGDKLPPELLDKSLREIQDEFCFKLEDFMRKDTK